MFKWLCTENSLRKLTKGEIKLKEQSVFLLYSKVYRYNAYNVKLK